MAIGEDKIRIQAIVDRKLERKINELADRMEMSQSRMIYLLLDCAIEDNEWIIRMMSSRFAKKVRKALRGKSPEAKSILPAAESS